MTDSLPPSDWPPLPGDRAGREAWLRDRENTLVAALGGRMAVIVQRALDAFLGSLTADAGDLTPLDRIPVEWAATITSEAGDFLGDVYVSGGLNAWRLALTAWTTLPDQVMDRFPNVVNQAAVEYQAQATNRLVGIGHDVWGDIREATVRAVQTGKPMVDLRDEVRDIAGVAERRAETIARTEVHQAMTAGDRRGAEALGQYGPVEHVWVAALDARTRESHAAAHDQVQPFNVPFDVGGYRMMRPGDGPPEEVINCRCYEEMLYAGFARPDGSVVDAPATGPAVGASEP